MAIIIKAFAVVPIAAAMASFTGSADAGLARREPEMAVLWAMGANRRQLALLVLAEAVALVLPASLVAAVCCWRWAWLLSHGVLPGLAVRSNGWQRVLGNCLDCCALPRSYC